MKHSKFCSFRKTISLKKKKACFRDTSILTKIALYPDLTGVAIFWLVLSIFWNVENTLPILVRHSKRRSFMKTISFKKKKHVLGTFQFSAKSLYPDLTGVAIFWLLLSIFWNDENILPILVKHSKFCSFMNTVSFKKKKHVLGTFQFSTKSRIRTLPEWPFFGWFWEFFGMMKISCQLLWNIQNFVLSWNTSQFQEKKACFAELFNFWQNRCIRTVPAWPFFVDFEYFLKCWKCPSNSCETFKILFFHENNQFEEKKACFGDFSIWTKIKILFFYEYSQFQEKKACFGYPDLTGVAIFCWFWVFFEMLKIPFQLFWNIQNSVLSWR